MRQRVLFVAVACLVCSAGSASLCIAQEPRRPIAVREAEVARLRDRLSTAKVDRAIRVDPGTGKVSATAVPSSAAAIQAGVLYRVPVEHSDSAQVDASVSAQLPIDAARASPVLAKETLRQLAQDGGLVDLKPYILPGRTLLYDASTQAFAGSILVGVAEIAANPRGSRPLTAPVFFQVRESNYATPASVQLTTTSPPHSEIQIRTTDLVASLKVHVTSPFNPEGSQVELPVSPTLILRSEEASIQAFGLGVTKLHIIAVGAGASGNTRVQLAIDPNGILESSSITLVDGAGEATLRSDFPGRATVTASAAGFAIGRTVVDYVTPWRTLSVGAIGGLIGGSLRAFKSGKKSSVSFVGLIVSIVVGLVVVALYALGVRALPIGFGVTSGYVFVLIAALFGGYLGIALLDRIAGTGRSNKKQS